MDYTNKRFKVTMPLTKSEDGDDGFYYIEFGLSTNTKDLEDEQVTDKCLDDMIKQAKNINGFEGHHYGLNSVIGPVVDAWKETVNKIQMMFVKVRVKPSMKDIIKELIDTGVRLGGSMGGLYVDDYVEDGIRYLEEVKLLDATLTPMPANFDTLGTAREATKTCESSICRQITKSIEKKYFKEKHEGPPGLENDDDELNKSKTHKEEFVMDEDTKKEILGLLEESNEGLVKSIVEGLKEVQKEEPPEEPPKEDPKKEEEEPPAAKELDKNELAKEVLEILGIEIPEETPEDETAKGYVVLSQDGLKSLVKDGILEHAKENRNPDKERKSKSQGAGKFENVGEKAKKSEEETEDKPVEVNGHVVPNPLKTKSIKDLAKGTAQRMGLKP